MIEAARDTGAGSGTADTLRPLVGRRIVDTQPQSRFNDLDVALLLDDGRVLELFSDYLYGICLMTIGGVTIEGPLQSSDPA